MGFFMQFERVWTARWQCLLGRQNPRPQTWSARDVMSEQCLVIFVLALRQADVREWLVLPPVSLDARRTRMHVFIYFLTTCRGRLRSSECGSVLEPFVRWRCRRRGAGTRCVTHLASSSVAARFPCLL